MARRTLGWILISGFALLLGSARALAQPASAADEGDTTEGAEVGSPAPARGALTAKAAPAARTLMIGAGARGRWISVPGWVLNGFTKENQPLSSYAVAGELFLRRRSFDIMLGVGYANLSPPDGNWLGRTNMAATDTDYVQFRSLGMWAVDVSFIWHNRFGNWFGIHYGAGLGVGILTGKILRTSNSGCTDANAGDPRLCHPRGVDPASPVPVDTQIQSLGTGFDDPNDPHRFEDGNVPPAVPIINALLGVDFRLPQLPGLEAKLEGGFYDAFFLGGGLAYLF